MSQPPSTRSTVKRKAQRGAYDRATIDSILDQAMICHVGICDDGQPFVLPMLHVRLGDQIYLHGSPASRLLQALAGGAEAGVTVTLVDGLVLARSAMHHSMNYRSVVVFGTVRVVVEEVEKWAALEALTEHLIPGRWAEVRQPNEHGLRQTLVLAIRINDASAKIRSGPPIDDEADYALPVWAGVIPLRVAADEAIADSKLRPGIERPGYASNYPGPR